MWSARPFIRILLFFCIGILVYRYLPSINNLASVTLLTIAIALFLTITTLTLREVQHKYSWVIGLLFYVVIALSGYFIAQQNDLSNNKSIEIKKTKPYLATIINNPSETNKAVKAIARIVGIGNDTITKSIKVLCYFEKDSSSLSIKYGDLITFSGNLSLPDGPMNPGEFDFRNYLHQDGIYHTVYLSSDNWELIGHEPPNPIIAIAGKIRNKLLTTLSENGIVGDNYAVAAAILLGYDNLMESDLKQDFIMAGAMHILCVSGLHVGIIYLVINFILGFLANNRINNILKFLILFFTVWAYAAITGLSPSVQRASLMISVFIIGNLISRQRDTYNTLAISAFILLVINPSLLFNVGFQLSYAAVLGIITFHQPIYKLIYVKNLLLDSIWSITALSISAQLATFPIATYYFHFFPPWFWLSNLFTFPLSFLIIVTGLIFVTCSWIPMISNFLGMVLSSIVQALNYSVGIVKYLPLSGIENIYTSILMLIIIYIMMILIYILLTQNKIKLLLPIIFCLLIISSLTTHHKYEILSQKKIVIYKINKHSAYEFIDGDKQLILADSTLISSNKSDYFIKNSRAKWGISSHTNQLSTKKHILSKIITQTGRFIEFNNKKILLCNGISNYYPTNSKPTVDLIMISGKTKTNIVSLSNTFNINKIVIDSSVPIWKRKKIIDSCSELGIPFYDVNSEGALIIDL